MSGQNKQLAEELSVLLSELSQGEIDSIDASLPLSSQGLDSILLVAFLSRIESRYEVAFDEEQISSDLAIDDLVELIDSSN
ncbi:acyl carrier protein [Corynebacterium matruchotii]|jgi:phosphopantetheine attachment domain protein|uniref:acyl carrier protein n=1 Tax=Corynebacterium matruchotii TaxID=43768 RepID=UPI00055247BD|nr:acyl carrier protein [Corynebacterium matruchotii]